MKTKCFIIDVDNTICESNRSKKYADLLPIQEVINKIKSLHRQGAYIILHTARGMKTYDGNLELINAFVRPVLETWLTKYDVPYDELIVGKPGYKSFIDTVYYVDDRSLSRKEFIESDPTDYENLTDQDITYE